MIDLSHNYALLDDGTIEPLWYNNDHSPDNQRMAYKDEDGKYYLDHDRPLHYGGGFSLIMAYVHSEIIRTADTKEELER